MEKCVCFRRSSCRVIVCGIVRVCMCVCKKEYSTRLYTMIHSARYRCVYVLNERRILYCRLSPFQSGVRTFAANNTAGAVVHAFNENLCTAENADKMNVCFVIRVQKEILIESMWSMAMASTTTTTTTGGNDDTGSRRWQRQQQQLDVDESKDSTTMAHLLRRWMGTWREEQHAKPNGNRKINNEMRYFNARSVYFYTHAPMYNDKIGKMRIYGQSASLNRIYETQLHRISDPQHENNV